MKRGIDDLVTVIFPVGPGVREAGEALGDLLGQSWERMEIVAVLNGCGEGVREEFLEVRDERLRVFDLGREGDLMGALDRAVRESRGGWLARMDADDRCDRERIAAEMELLSEGEHEVVSCGISLVGALGAGMGRYVEWVNGLVGAEEVARERFVESPVVQPTVILSKRLFEEVGGYRRNEYAEDYDLWLRLLERGARFGKVDRILYEWRDREDRLTRSDPRFGQKRMLALKAEYLARLPAVRERGVVFSGAGPIGKVLARELLQRGVKVEGFFEVDEKRVGRTCQGAPIAGLEEFGKRWRDAVLLSAVGVPGGREKVRSLAKGEGYGEGEDFWCCC